jgi:lysophospholipase L1-like esterase
VKLSTLIALVALALPGVSVMSENFISADNPSFQYFGRVYRSNPGEVSFDWPGVIVACRFQGTTCKAIMQGKNCFDVFVDNKYQKTVAVAEQKDTILISDKLSKGIHTLKIAKRSESNSNVSVFYGLVLDNNSKLQTPPAEQSRKMEFVGDSYTAGFGNEFPFRECKPEECDSNVFHSTNTGKAFGPLIAGVFNAQYQVNAISGKGLIRNYNGIDKGKEFLNSYDKTLQSSINSNTKSPLWDFKSWHPDVIVIGLGINDFQADPPYPDSVIFDSTYTSFIKFLQSQHPGVKVICCATKIWPTNSLIPRIKKIVDDLKNSGDKNVFYFEFETENTALYGHPSLKDHEKIAKELVPVVETVTGWK